MESVFAIFFKFVKHPFPMFTKMQKPFLLYLLANALLSFLPSVPVPPGSQEIVFIMHFAMLRLSFSIMRTGAAISPPGKGLNFFVVFHMFGMFPLFPINPIFFWPFVESFGTVEDVRKNTRVIMDEELQRQVLTTGSDSHRRVPASTYQTEYHAD